MSDVVGFGFDAVFTSCEKHVVENHRQSSTYYVKKSRMESHCSIPMYPQKGHERKFLQNNSDK